MRVRVDHGKGCGSGRNGGIGSWGGLHGQRTRQHLSDGQHQQYNAHAQTLDGDHGQCGEKRRDHAHYKGAGHQREADASQKMMTKGATLCGKRAWN